jgi:hypothetical protein
MPMEFRNSDDQARYELLVDLKVAAIRRRRPINAKKLNDLLPLPGRKSLTTRIYQRRFGREVKRDE